MLEISTDDQEVEIRGTANGLRDVRLTIIGLLSSHALSASIQATTKNSGPNSRAIKELVIERSFGPTLLTIAGSSLLVIGSDDSLARFSSWFDLPPEAHPGYHAHFEPLPDDPHHSFDCIPLTVVLG